MPKYRRIPGEPIEAVQWTAREIGTTHPGVFYEGYIGFFVVTIHGQKTKIVNNDWILPEPDGIHYYPCKPDVFAKTYELAEPPGLQKAIMDTCGLRDDDPIGTLAGDEQIVAVDTTDVTEGALDPAPLDPATPTCTLCGARVYSPCSDRPKTTDSLHCQLPPDTVYVDDRRFWLARAYAMPMSANEISLRQRIAEQEAQIEALCAQVDSSNARAVDLARENERLRHEETARFRTLRRDVKQIKRAVRA